ncbi:MAG: hypothetical protein LBC63_04395 [Holophagales bacterium]|jgi:hypothetical protein|nr:hypothetical protein [Holophagales bacterium]
MKKHLISISVAIGFSLVAFAQIPKKAQGVEPRQLFKIQQASPEFQKSWTSIPMIFKGGDVIALGKKLVVNQEEFGINQEEPRFQVQFLSDEKNDAAAFSVYLSGNDVYVAGVERQYGTDPVLLERFTSKATIWKNGTIYQHLGESQYNSAANSIFISGDDVYAVGYETDGRPKNQGFFLANGPVFQRFLNEVQGGEIVGNHSSAIIWKNGKVFERLSDGKTSVEAKSIFISGKDVYVAVEADLSTLWGKAQLLKNGKDQSLEGVNYRKASVANSVFVLGNDVYVAGAKRDSQPGVLSTGTPFHAVIWKNRKEYQRLTDGKFDGEAFSIFVSGNDIYAAGIENNSRKEEFATIWKNGKILYRLNDTKFEGLSETILEGKAKSIFVSGNDVYVAGWIRSGSLYTHTTYALVQKPGNRKDAFGLMHPIYEVEKYSVETNIPVAILWKNGQVYSRFGDGKSASEAHSVVVSGDDIYVAGFVTNKQGNRVATLWKGK